MKKCCEDFGKMIEPMNELISKVDGTSYFHTVARFHKVLLYQWWDENKDYVINCSLCSRIAREFITLLRETNFFAQQKFRQ